MADFNDLEALDGLMAGLAAAHTDIDLLVLGAGVDVGQSMLALDWRAAVALFEVNTLADLVIFEHLLPVMEARETGHVTAIVSMGALIGSPYEGLYSASKAALGMLIDSARAECRPRGIRSRRCTRVS